MSARLLIVEDDARLNQMLNFHFEDEGYQVEGVLTCSDALVHLRAEARDLILLDQQLPDGTGIELLKKIREEVPDQAVIMMTGQHDLELAIQAIKEGAADFIHKPVKTEELQHTVERVLENQRLSRAVEALRPEPAELADTSELIGRSDAMLQVSKEIALSAESSANVLITGESGTGKEVVARLIHVHSNRPGPFVALNCAAIVETLLESELFGHEKGAFTGAVERKLGKFELARDGTLFLDEIGELALPLQAKLLRVLQEHVFERVGGNQQIATDARVIAATNRDLLREVEEHRFREDLIYRLRVVAIHLPPLRERRDDIPLLAKELMNKIARNIRKPALTMTEGVLERLQGYDWPGNVREFENVLTQAMVHARGPALTPDLISVGAATPMPSPGFPEPKPQETQALRTLDEVEAEYVQRVLNHTGGHKGHTCDILGISRPALDRKIKKYALKVPVK